MFAFKNLYGNLGFQTSYEESIPEGTEQEALANDQGQATVSPKLVKNVWLSLAAIVLVAYFISR